MTTISLVLTVATIEARGATTSVSIDTILTRSVVLAWVYSAIIDILLTFPPSETRNAITGEVVDLVIACAIIQTG